MRELALHALDLVENAVRAGATIVAVEVAEDLVGDLLSLVVEDDGPGLAISQAQATDPFCTTKAAKPLREQAGERGRDDFGLGLSLLAFRCEQADGKLVLGPSELGGLAVRATFRFSHVDRSPLGDLAATLSGVVATNPGLELRVRLRCGDRERRLCSTDAAQGLVAARPGRPGDGMPATIVDANTLAVARRILEQIKEGLQALQIKE